jgi:thiosulfate dehydrogenase
MKRQNVLIAAGCCVLTAALSAWVAARLARVPGQPPAEQKPEIRIMPTTLPADACVLRFNPPQPQDAPGKLGEAVMLGYRLITETKKYASDYVGNNLTCSNCHFQGGRDPNGLPLVGVAAKYPRYMEREGYSTDLVERTNGCFERSMNGKPLPVDSREMQAILAYYQWISKGIPIYAEIPWLGLPPLDSDHQPNRAAGRDLYPPVCARCHGQDGEGTPAGPAVWGDGSFNDGAGMAKLSTAARFIHAYMPRDNPTLTAPQALDLAAYLTAQPRPHFRKLPSTQGETYW